MIEGLKSDDIIMRMGGRFKLTALIQRRLVELLQGARPMVETRGLSDLEVVVRELMEGKIDMHLPSAGGEEEDAIPPS